MDSIPSTVNIFKEFVMTYGLLEATLVAVILILVWRLPNMVEAFAKYIEAKKNNDS